MMICEWDLLQAGGIGEALLRMNPMVKWGIVRSSMRVVGIITMGGAFWVWADNHRSLHGPYRRSDKRFRLMPKGWTP